MPVHSNMRAVSLRHAADDVVGPTLLLMRGRGRRRRSAVDVVKHAAVVFKVVAPLITVVVL